MAPPGSDKLTTIDQHGRCAATQLLQARLYGTSAVRACACIDRNEVAWCSSPNRFELAKEAGKAVDEKLSKLSTTKDLGSTMVAFSYELYTGHAEYYDHFGYLMWMDASRTRFIMLEHFEEKFCTERFLNLVQYLQLSPTGPLWVRASWISTLSPTPDDRLFDLSTASIPVPLGESPVSSPAILHVTSGQASPHLHTDDLIPLNSLLLRAGFPLPSTALRKRTVKRGFRELVPSLARDRNDFAANSVARPCQGCGNWGNSQNLLRCSCCLMAFYCSPACEKK